MTSSIPAQPSEASRRETDELLQRYGIVRIPAEHFEYGGYRYTNIKDAIAEAVRREALMSHPAHPSPEMKAHLPNGLHPGAGALTSHRESRVKPGRVEAGRSTEEWVNEGGSIAPETGRGRS